MAKMHRAFGLEWPDSIASWPSFQQFAEIVELGDVQPLDLLRRILWVFDEAGQIVVCYEDDQWFLLVTEIDPLAIDASYQVPGVDSVIHAMVDSKLLRIVDTSEESPQ